MLSYWNGISLSKERFEKFFKVTYRRLIGVVVIIGFQMLSYKYSYNYFLREIALLSFSVLIVLLTMTISVDNKFLRFCGAHLFAIYILQRIPMILFKSFGMADYNTFLYVLCCFVFTLIVIWPFEQAINRLWGTVDKGF